MDANEARLHTQSGVEHMQSLAEEAREKNERQLASLDELITNIAEAEREKIETAILGVANKGEQQATHSYVERISASLKPREEVRFIKDVSDIVSVRVGESLTADGFEVDIDAKEIRDFRQKTNELPEYYETTFKVRW